MAASEKTYVGLAKQSAKGTPNSTDGEFKYFLFAEGALAPNNLFIPSDDEVGGGALTNDVDKVGVFSAGAFQLTPRPEVLGHFLMGALGNVADPALASGAAAAYEHVFTLGSDQFQAPYYTFRTTPGGLWGEEFEDVRIAALALNWKAADRVRGTLALQGLQPTPNVDTATWSADAAVDRGPSFLAPVTNITFPGIAASDLKVLSGAMTFGMDMPMDDQWVTGSYFPDDVEITKRRFSITMNLKVMEGDLYEMLTYDPDQGGAWAATAFKEGGFTLEFQSSSEIEAGHPYSMLVEGNGGAGQAGNIAWTVTPVSIRAGRPVLMSVTGVVLADAGDPITVTLTNAKSTKY